MKYRGLIFLALVTLIFFLSYSIPPLYAVNQHTYYPHGLWLSGADYLEYDWYSRTQPAHLAFSLLIAGLNKAGLLAAGSTLIEVLLSLALIGGWWLQIYAVLTDLHEQKFTWPQPLSRLFLASVILGGVIVSWVLWWEMYFWIQTTGFRPRLHFFTLTGGFAGQYIFGGYLQPSEFGILMLLGVGLIQLRRPAWAVILFAIAATFQFSYFIHASIMVLIVVVWLYRTGQRTRTLRSALLYAALTLPTFVYALSFSINQPETSEAARILAQERIPHHALPEEWLTGSASVMGLIMLLAAVVVVWRNRGVLRWLFPLSVAYTFAGIALVAVTGSNQLGLLFPWRGSTYLLPLGIIILFSYGGTAILRAGMKRSMRFWPLTQALVLVGLLVCVLIRLPRDGSGEIVAEPSTETVITDLLNNTVVAEPDEVFLVPLNWNWFRLNTQHPIYVDLKNHPYLPSEVIEWWRRVNLAETFYAQPTILDEQLSQACQQFNVAYVMIADSQARLSAVPIAAAKGFQLFRCPASST